MVTTNSNLSKKAPPGWLNISDMNRAFGVSNNSICKAIEKLDGLEVQHFESHRSNRSVKYPYYSPASVKIIKSALGNLITAKKSPDSWKNARELSEITGVTLPILNKYLKKLKDANHPLAQSKLLINSKSGRVGVLYSPRIISALDDASQGFFTAKVAPAGWMSESQMAVQWNVAGSVVTGVIKTIGKIDNLESRNYKSVGGKMLAMHYSPRSVVKIHGELQNHIFISSNKTDGWLTIRKMASEWNINRYSIKKTINTLDSLETVKHHLSNGKVRIYYSPKSVKLIKLHLDNRQ